MSNPVLQVEERPPIARLILNRPEVHNAFDDQLLGALDEALGRLATRRELRVVVLAGAGRSFCAGADLNWMQRAARFTRQENIDDSERLGRVLTRLFELPQPTIARVHGAVVGGGNGLVAACDFVIASERATFRLSEVKLGLAPAVISPFLIRRWGERTCRRLFLTGQRLDAAAAATAGIVDRVVADDELERAIDALIEQLIDGGPRALAACKELVRRVPHLEHERAMPYVVELLADLRAGDEGQEGMAAFLAKREPAWRVRRPSPDRET